jgi:hypothetical protein
MNRSQYITISLVLVLIFIFLKIYQHNSIIKLVYRQQRIDKEKLKARQERNSLLVKFYKMKNQENVRSLARNKLALQSLKPSQVITTT